MDGVRVIFIWITKYKYEPGFGNIGCNSSEMALETSKGSVTDSTHYSFGETMVSLPKTFPPTNLLCSK